MAEEITKCPKCGYNSLENGYCVMCGYKAKAEASKKEK